MLDIRNMILSIYSKIDELFHDKYYILLYLMMYIYYDIVSMLSHHLKMKKIYLIS
jgi:hypothetical protein